MRGSDREEWVEVCDDESVIPSIRTVHDELTASLGAVDPEEYTALREAVRSADRRVLVAGQGRSGLVAQMAAMRFMHLGADAHAVGEPTAPPVGPGDLLVLVSGSGSTPVTLAFAEVGRSVGARIAAVTRDGSSPLADAADVSVTVASDPSAQFAGSRFEQVTLLLFDALVLDLSGGGADIHAAMQARHTNLQ